MSQYSDHEEEEEEEVAAAEGMGKKEDERAMRRSSVEGAEETKPGTAAFIRRKRRSTAEGEQRLQLCICVSRLCRVREQEA